MKTVKTPARVERINKDKDGECWLQVEVGGPPPYTRYSVLDENYFVKEGLEALTSRTEIIVETKGAFVTGSEILKIYLKNEKLIYDAKKSKVAP